MSDINKETLQTQSPLIRKTIIFQPLMKLWEGNVFTDVCLSLSSRVKVQRGRYKATDPLHEPQPCPPHPGPQGTLLKTSGGHD